MSGSAIALYKPPVDKTEKVEADLRDVLVKIYDLRLQLISANLQVNVCNRA